MKWINIFKQLSYHHHGDTMPHLKSSKHRKDGFYFSGYSVMWHNRVGRWGEGVGVYVRSSLKPTSEDNDSKFELLWVRLYRQSTQMGFLPARDSMMLIFVEIKVEEIAASNQDTRFGGEFQSTSITLRSRWNKLQRGWFHWSQNPHTARANRIEVILNTCTKKKHSEAVKHP